MDSAVLGQDDSLDLYSLCELPLWLQSELLERDDSIGERGKYAGASSRLICSGSTGLPGPLGGGLSSSGLAGPLEGGLCSIGLLHPL